MTIAIVDKLYTPDEYWDARENNNVLYITHNDENRLHSYFLLTLSRTMNGLKCLIGQEIQNEKETKYSTVYLNDIKSIEVVSRTPEERIEQLMKQMKQCFCERDDITEIIESTVKEKWHLGGGVIHEIHDRLRQATGSMHGVQPPIIMLGDV